MTMSCTSGEEKAWPKQFWLGMAIAALLWALLGVGTVLT